MKTINELVSEAASEYSDIAEYNAYESIIANIAFKKAATFATNLTFERCVEALKSDEASDYFIDKTNEDKSIVLAKGWADWLLANREKIIGDKI